MIPKRVAFFWGNETMSWMRWMTLLSFRKLNPDWQIDLYLCKPNGIKTKTWKDAPIQDFFNFDGEDYFKKAKALDINLKKWRLIDQKGKSWEDKMGPSHKSNFFKWQELGVYGGIYSDLDILWVKPMDAYYEKIKHYNTMICYRHTYFSIGLLGASPNNKFFYDLF